MEKITQSAPIFHNASLSRREVSLLANWERQRRAYVTMDDVRRAVGVRPAPDVTKALVRKGVLQRLRPGLYLIRPIRSLSRPTAPSSVMSLAVLLHDEPYYIGGLWAFTLHQLTEQQYVSALDAFVTRNHAGRELFGARLAFHRVSAERLQYGIIQTKIENVDVAVSDLEGTLLDALDHPAIVGGLLRAYELVSTSLRRKRADHRKLVAYAARGSRDSTCRRLGVMLERAQVSESAVRPLRKRLVGSRSVLSMVPGPRRGHVNERWSVVENDR